MPPNVGAMTRTVLASFATALLLLTGCSGDSEDKEPAKASESASAEGRVNALGVSFKAPEGWTVLDASEMAEGSADNDAVKELAGRLNVTPEQFEEMMGGIQLYLASGDGAKNGFLDNINVSEAGDKLPNDTQIEAEFLTLGATVQGIERLETEAGDAARVTYDLPVQDGVVHAQALVVETEVGLTSITISTSDAKVAESLGDGIVDTLAAG